MTINLFIFLALATVAVGSALAMLFTRNAVLCALYLILNFLTVAIFYLTLNAPFIAISQVTVYAGAIMVLFLFVIMLLGAEQTGRTAARWWFQPAALILGLVLLVETMVIVFAPAMKLPGFPDVAAGFGAPLQVGSILFEAYILPFEATSVLLLTSMIGAIVLTRSAKTAGSAKTAASAKVSGAAKVAASARPAEPVKAAGSVLPAQPDKESEGTNVSSV